MKKITFACLTTLMLNLGCTPEEQVLNIGFGSCNEPNQTQHLLPTLNKALDSLDHFIWLGDNIYLNNEQWNNLFGKFESPMLPKIKNIAMRYHGHQFQVYNPDIGDGRGFTIAQFYKNNELYDLGTKGSGVTPYSRSGDGRLTLKGGVREVLCSNYLDALGVNTSKSLSLIETGEHLSRNDEPSPTRSSVLVRVSHSHLRIGTFQYHAFHQDFQSIEFLTNAIGKYYFNLNDQNNQPIKIFSEVVQRCATLAASYNVYGFVHGVLNTDNINITGESFDYGPYRFLEKYEPNKTAAYFDRFGLYRFSKQADAIFWNVQQLASIFTLMDLRLSFSDF